MKQTKFFFITLALSITMLLSACNGSDNGDSNNSSADVPTLTSPNINQSIHHGQTPPQEAPQGEWSDPDAVVYGMVFGIDGTKVTINASNIMVFFDPNTFITPTDGSQVQEVKEDTLVRISDETEIEVRTSNGAQIIAKDEGTVNDITLQDIVIAEGAWDGDEFAAAKLIIIKLRY